MPTDTERLDWLERQANQPDGLHLHNGNPKPSNDCRGIGLRPGSLVRTLREAIDQCMGFDAGKKEDGITT